MGDAGEAWIDAEAKIQERMEELQADRALPQMKTRGNPEQTRQIASLKLARSEMSRQLGATAHPARRIQITDAIAEIDRRIAAMGGSTA